MKYCVIIQTELESSVDQYIARKSVKLFDDLNEAKAYGREIVSQIHDYPAEAGFSVYQLMED